MKLLESAISRLRHLFITSKTLPIIGVLIVSYKYVEITVVYSLMYYLMDSKEDYELDQRTAAVVTNLHNGLSSMVFVIVSLVSETYTGCFTAITFCAAASIQGLMILWRSASSSSAERAIYAGIVFLALGNSGQKLAENFLLYQLQQKINSKEQDNQTSTNTIPTNIWLTAPSIVGYIITISTYFLIENEKSYEEVFRFAALLMGGAFLLFLFGCVWYRHEELAGESNIRKIQRICKVGLRKRKSKYPTTGDSYYWKGYKQAHLYEHGEGLRLLPRVPRQFRWLDKAAILKAEDQEDASPAETQEKKGKLCTVKDVREVKSLVPMIYLFVAFFAHSLLMASGNTFFIAQAGTFKNSITKNGNDVWILILMTDGMSKMSRFVCFIIRSAFGWLGVFKGMENGAGRLKRKSGTIIRIGFGMSCAVVCGVVAWYYENRRGDPKKGGTTVTLIPQFLLLGMSEGLVDGGLENLFKGHVAKSMWRFEDSFIGLVFGVGELLIIPFIFSSWIQKSVDESHLEKLYLMLAILNGVFLLGFGYYSVRYAYREECPEDEKVTVEETLETAPVPDSKATLATEIENAQQPVYGEKFRSYERPYEDNEEIVAD